MTNEWRKSQCISEKQPDTIDATSSRDFVYVRRNMKSTPQVDMDGIVVGGTYIWDYEEQLVDKKDWGIYATVLENQRLDAEQDQLILNHDFELLCIKEQITDII